MPYTEFMIKLLSALLIRDRKNYADPDVRRKYGILCSSLGIFLNVMLFAAKLAGSVLSGSIAMLADAFNNLSDAASSFISVLGFKLSGKKPDLDHPFGHGRIEYVAGLIVSFLILFMGLELFRSSIKSILHPAPVEKGIIPVAIMIAAVGVKLYMYLYNHSMAKKLNSPTMEAVAKDSLGDMISTSVVILSVIASSFTSLPVDGIGGLIVAVFIFKEGIESYKDTVDPLLGQRPEKKFVEEIEQEVMKFKPIMGIHDMIIHDYGPGRLMISFHAEVPGDRNIFEIHEVIDCVELELYKKFGCAVVIHMDPVDLHNERLSILKELIKEESLKLDPRFTVHDVRMVPGEKRSNLIFDIVRPHDCRLSESEIRARLSQAIQEKHSDINCIIIIDSPYI